MNRFFVLLLPVFMLGVLIFDKGEFKASSVQTEISEEDRARALFEDFDERRRAITYETSLMEMRIIDRRERVRSRSMRTWSYSGAEASRSLTQFEAPADVRGTGLLTLEENGSEQQLLYLPAVGRVQTVSGSQRTERFLGSDFTFEDLGNQNPDDFDFEILTDTETELKIKAVPKSESQYAWIHFHLDPQKMVLNRADYFNDRGEQFKKLTASDYQEVREGVWRPGTMIMRDLEANRRTEIRWKERVFDEPIPSRFFTERHLQRGVQ
ncbi:outer membrane lipoprotein-sorting protein [Cyclonatronum proteinivorum]|uniref:Outer membrane lipoprotein-sorting protein n=1 Tax=Cyclonatronum proteinivorum TaxID=1457365 RepID=A0A345UGU1_9BACT|nr:outer membrane lipoprotein-sorting protein [Cyclonatronum proteinivorum]AXI99692.1 outer membrane lipoprotein-sorting protein [Cyclonatronum proteinivorum]